MDDVPIMPKDLPQMYSNYLSMYPQPLEELPPADIAVDEIVYHSDEDHFDDALRRFRVSAPSLTRRTSRRRTCSR